MPCYGCPNSFSPGSSISSPWFKYNAVNCLCYPTIWRQSMKPRIDSLLKKISLFTLQVAASSLQTDSVNT